MIGLAKVSTFYNAFYNAFYNFIFYYGEVLKWGRLRAPPGADAASNKEWQRSKFGDAFSGAPNFRHRNR